MEIKYISIPKVCPVCNTLTEEKNNDGIRTLWCPNPACEGKIINRINHFMGKTGLDIKGLGKATLQKLLDWGYIDSISSVFRLSEWKKEWQTQSGFGVKSVESILQSIEEGRHTTLEAVISAAGIPLVGRTVAKTLAR